MRSRPGIQMTAGAKPTTQVLCPAGCGHVVLRLAGDEGVYRSGSAGAASGQTRTESGTCGNCREPYNLPVTAEVRR